MAEIDTNALIGYLAAGVGALTTLGVGIREYLKREKVSSASDASSIKGFQGNDKVLDNLVGEVARLSARISDLETKVQHLTDKLTTVRTHALECYQLVSDCECPAKEEILELLKQIIKDA